MGFEGNELESRVRLFLYYEVFESMMFDKPSAKTEDALIEFRHQLLTKQVAWQVLR